ncbi:Outer membrane lipoprotein precursor, OmpA family [Candidatus Rhodobacter oscarellae]|uniref:Outer membrane lipoprotein, OmpA family n=1 Tax=Candidatus Rhodobacter oscarellae TaxID=1675527 RepID=A0A0J9EA57_9RHOB|nr:OmpA family protein [Candidatus Rhodobacter lobularis]KMW59521.1 Outer membrane lipoprotein precursor, OmpA family [Candidatus Rhodobacter lobularis]
MGLRKVTLFAAVGLATLAACGNNENWHKEAGSFYTSRGSFGEATALNIAYQTGERSFVVDLNNRFSQEVLTTVNFAFNSAQLDEAARDILRVQAQWIKQFPEIRFKVYGHTDAVGSRGYNKQLGKRRAHAVVNFLTTQGIHRSRLVAAISFGEDQPLIVTQGRERLNRRTVTEVTGFMSNNPATLDGKYAEIIMREYIESATEQPPNTESGLESISGQSE